MGWLCLLEITRQRHLLKSLKVTTCHPRIIIQGWQGKQERDHWEAWCSKAYIVDLSPWQENFKTEFEVQNLVKDRKILWLAKHPDLRKVLTWVGRSKQWHAITQLDSNGQTDGLASMLQLFVFVALWLETVLKLCGFVVWMFHTIWGEHRDVNGDACSLWLNNISDYL